MHCYIKIFIFSFLLIFNPSAVFALPHVKHTIQRHVLDDIIFVKTRGKSKVGASKNSKSVKPPQKNKASKTKIHKPAISNQTNTSTSKQIKKIPKKNANEMAKDVAKGINRNSVTIKTTPNNGNSNSIRYDLRSTRKSGAAHYNKSLKKAVPTPHKVKETVHVNKNPTSGKIYKNRKTTDPVSMTKSDVRIVKRYLNKQEKKK